MKLALGTAQFGLDYGINNSKGQVTLSEVKKILHYANSKGLTTLDTASEYGNSEKRLGKIGVSDFHIITKTTPLTHNLNNVIKNFQKSLVYLKVKQVYGLLIHNIDDIKSEKFDDLFDKLHNLKALGKIKKLGFSIYTPEQASFLLNNFKFDLIQVPFNIIDRRMIDSGIFSKLKQNNIEIHARSIFLQGLLIMPKEKRPKKFNRWNNLWKIWDQWLSDNQISALEATVRYSLSNPQVTKVIFGVNSLIQLKEVLVSISGDLPKLPNELLSDDVELLDPSNW